MAKLRRRNEAGHALATTMVMTAFLMPLGAFALMQARLDLLMNYHTRAAIEVFCVAEAGIEHALADLDLDPSFDRLLAGPDKRIDTADDQDFPFRNEPPTFFPRAPLRYDVKVERQGLDNVEILAYGFGVDQAARTIVASVSRSATPYLPGAVSSSATTIGLLLGEQFAVTGVADGQFPLPALSVQRPETAQILAAQLPDYVATQLTGRGDAPSISEGTLLAAESFATAAAQAPAATLLDPNPDGSLGSGISISHQSVEIMEASGNGVLVVHGDLHVSERLSFTGLVVVFGDVRFDRGSLVNIDGALVQGAPGDQLHLLGTGSIAYNHEVIERVDAQLPHVLPRRAIATGWREAS